MKTEGAVAFITGAGSGLGKDIAKGVAKAGAIIIAVDINKNAVEQTVADIREDGGTAESCVLDIANRKAVYKKAASLIKKYGHVDILVNNAGIVVGKDFLESTDEENIATMEVNTISNFWTVKAFLPGMIERKSGHLVTIASAAAFIGVPRLADYCASKFAAFGFHEAIRKEIRKKKLRDVKTTIICPYYINTGMFSGVKKSPLSFLLPLLDQKKTTDKIVKAITKQKRRLYMPPIVYTLPMLRVFPDCIYDFIADLFGVNSSMDEFKGHKK
ncbi:MAG: SDR family oxidoreductase [Spirochaetes bacterium]|jgi:all-trans-retinol dehydrogenase (NAD+)|nr:SDR family oxidoreductase [Spirochaetota bacterium]